VGEINEQVPRTLGDTQVHINDFNALVLSSEPPIYLGRWAVTDVYDRLAANVASIVENGSCLAFSIGPTYDALARHLASKKDLGVHTPFFTDGLMDLVKCGAITNRRKGFFRGKSLVSYALGTPELMKWLDRNPLVEFQPINVTADPKNMGLSNPFIAIMPARKADVTGGIALHSGQGNVTAGPGAVQEVLMGAALSPGGKAIFALPSRNRRREPNIVLSVDEFPNQFANRESLDMVATEYGIAYLTGRTVRERTQALIDIAHPDDRAGLVAQAKKAKILYQDQIYLPQSGHLYPEGISRTHTFKDGLRVHFRAIKPSDEDEMRRLFYRFSDKSVYYRYFSPIKTMPHSKMQEYVNVDYQDTMSIVGLVEDEGSEKVIAEARYARDGESRYADTAFIVDEEYNGKGIATYLFNMLINIALQRGIGGFVGDVLSDNKPMLEVYKKSPYHVKTVLENQIYKITIPFVFEEQ
jgi:GNAT superfamily N-acetyltransferase